jgi:hypothetical protein
LVACPALATRMADGYHGRCCQSLGLLRDSFWRERTSYGSPAEKLPAHAWGISAICGCWWLVRSSHCCLVTGVCFRSVHQSEHRQSRPICSGGRSHLGSIHWCNSNGSCALRGSNFQSARREIKVRIALAPPIVESAHTSPWPQRAATRRCSSLTASAQSARQTNVASGV